MEPSQPDAPRERGGLLRALVAVTAGLSLLVAGVGAYGYVTYEQAAGEVSTFATTSPPGNGQRDFGPCVKGVCNYLLLGSDSRAGLSKSEQRQFGTNQDIGGSNRSDVIMLVHTDPSLEKAVVLSFPRDLWVTIPGHGKNKINAAFEGGLNGGGPQLVARTVESLTGLHVNHILYVDLQRFQSLVQAIGGIDLCIPAYDVNTSGGRITDIKTGLNVKPGCQHLDGYQALAYVRTRDLRCDSVPDFSRIARQQQFLRAILNRILTPQNISQAPSLIKEVAHDLVTEPGFKLADIIYLVKTLQGISTGAVDFRTVPGIAGPSIVTMDPKAQLLFSALRNNDPLPPGIGTQLQGTAISPANITVPVVDDASGAGARLVESRLSESGFDVAPGVSPMATFGTVVKGSAIAYEPRHLEEAQVLQSFLPNLRMVQAKKHSLHGNQVAVFVTSSYHEVPITPSPSAQCVVPTAGG